MIEKWINLPAGVQTILKSCFERVRSISCGWFYVMVASTVMMTSIWFFNRELWTLSHKILHDDAFYYLKTAWMFAETGRITFDGATSTNGFHPLWMVVLMLLGFMTRLASGDKDAFLVVVMFTQCALLACTSKILVDLVLKQERFRVVRVGAMSLVSLILFPFVLCGMESGLTILLLALIISRVLGIAEGRSLESSFAELMWLFSMAALARYDLIIPLFLITAWLIIKTRRISFVIPWCSALMAIVVVVVFWRAQGFHCLSTSSVVKHWWATESFWEYLHVSPRHDVYDAMVYAFSGVENIIEATPFLASGLVSPLYPAISWSSAHVAWPGILKSAGYTLVCVVVPMSMFTAVRQNWQIYAQLLLVLAAGYFSMMIPARLFAFWVPSFSWYMCVGAVAFALSLIHVLVECRSKFVWLVCILLCFGGFIRVVRSGPSRWASVYQEAVRYLQGSGLVDELGGGWAVGHLAWFSQARIINLEGLIADESVHQANVTGTMDRYLQKVGVKYILFNAPVSWIEDARRELRPVFFRTRIAPLVKLKDRTSVAFEYRDNSGECINVILLHSMPTNGAALPVSF